MTRFHVRRNSGDPQFPWTVWRDDGPEDSPIIPQGDFSTWADAHRWALMLHYWSNPPIKLVPYYRHHPWWRRFWTWLTAES